MTFQLSKLFSFSRVNKISHRGRPRAIKKLWQHRNRYRIKLAIRSLFADVRKPLKAVWQRHAQPKSERALSPSALSYRIQVGANYRRQLAYEGLEERRLLAVATWDGGGADNLWDNPENWVGDVAPQVTDDIVFPESASQKTVAVGNWFHPYNSVSIDGQGYTLEGPNALRVRNLYINQSNLLVSANLGVGNIDQSYSMNVYIGAGVNASTALTDITFSGQVMTGLDAGKGLNVSIAKGSQATFSGTISGSGRISINSNDTSGPSSSVTLSGANTFRDTLTVSNAILVVKNQEALGIPETNQGLMDAGTILDSSILVLDNNVTIANEPLIFGSNINSNGYGFLLANDNQVVAWNGPISSSVNGGYALRFGSSQNATLNINSSFNVNTGISISGWGRNVINSSNSTATTLFARETNLVVDGTLNITGIVEVKDGAYILGTGQLLNAGTGYYYNGSRIAPGAPSQTGTLTLSNVLQYAGDLLLIQVNGTSQGQFDQLRIIGTASLQSNLELTLGTSIGLNETIVIVDNDSSDAILGGFAGLGEGSTLVATYGGNNEYFRISYEGGDGNDITLTRVPVAIWDGAPDAGGSSADSNWTTATNWVGDSVPSPLTTLVFPENAERKSMNNSFPANTQFTSIILAGSNYSVQGSAIGLQGQLDSYGTANSIYANIVLAGKGNIVSRSGTFNVYSSIDANSKALSLSTVGGSKTAYWGVISDSGISGRQQIVVQGVGEVELAAANTFDNQLLSVVSELTISNSQGLGVGDGTAATGTLFGRQGNFTQGNLKLVNNITIGNEKIPTVAADGLTISSVGNNTFQGDINAPAYCYLIANPGNTLTLSGNLSNSFNFYVRSGGKIIINGGSVQTGTLVLDEGGALQFDSTTTGNVLIWNGSTLSGSGSVGAVTVLAGGTISPGSSIGKLTAASLNMASTSTLALAINGTVAGSTHDWLEVTGAATLAGTLDVSSTIPIQKGDSLRLLTFASKTGSFGTINLPQYAGSVAATATLGDTYLDVAGRFLYVTNTNDSGTGSLRQAITSANSYSGADEIYFALPDGSPTKISPITSLPVITGPTRIDASRIVSGSKVPGIALDGSSIATSSTGFVVTGSETVISGFAVGGFEHGIEFQGNNNLAIGNYVGLDLDGNKQSNSYGFVVSGKNNRIGTGVAGDGNIISGNDKTNSSAGVWIGSANATGNRVQGNRIGTNPTGTAAVPNKQGVTIIDRASQNIVGTDGDGTSDASEGNLISGNTFGVNIENGNTENNRIAGNWIGLHSNGTGAIANTHSGIVVSASNNLIGTNGDGVSDELERNIISGNTENGVWLSFGTGNRIAGNYIGTTVAGTAKLGNATGILVTGSSGAIIGTNSDTLGDSKEGNVVSGNFLRGILITGNGSDGAIIAGNFIGTDPSGIVGLGNLGNGITISSANQVRIGTDGSNDAFNGLERNVISNNGQAGVEIGFGTNVSIAGNIIGLKADGITALGNSTDGILIGGGSAVVIGTDGNNIRDTDERNIISGNASAGINIYGPSSNIVVAGNYIGTDSQGAVARGNGTKGVEISGTSTNIRIGSLNDGVNEANERNVISGNNRAGIATIVNGTVISGNYLGTDASGTADVGNKENGIFVLGAVNTVIRGNIISGNDLTGIDVAYSNSTIIQANTIGLNAAGTAKISNIGRGIDVRGGTGNIIGTDGNGTNDSSEGNLISGNSQSGVRVYDNANSTRIAGNRIGTDSAGSAARGNSADGIRIEASQSTLIGTNGDGTSDTLERNIISGNSGNGITADSAAVVSLVIAGNYIGTSATGLARNSNEGSGISVSWVANAIIGGNLPAQGNLISGNNGDSGVHIAESTGIVVKNNFIGLNATGTSAIGQGNYGIRNHFSRNTEIANNNISGNGVGMFLYSSNDVTIAGNFIGLAPDGVNSIPNIYGGITAEECNRLLIGTRGLDASTSNGNYIAGNGYQQIRLNFGSQNVIAGNSIGVGVNGQAVIGGITEGSIAPLGIIAVSTIDLRIGTNGSDDAFNATEANIVGGNTREGIYLTGTVSSPNIRTVIAGNYIGVNSNGDKRANGLHGIHLTANNLSTIIGTNSDGNYDALESNVISGNNGSGVYLDNASGTVLAGNLIGLVPNGNRLANGLDGVTLSNSVNAVVGTNGDGVNDAIEGNIISGNNRYGVFVTANATNSRIAGNRIGVNAAGTAALGNSIDGIRSDNSTGTIIGTNGDGVSDTLESNIISGNTGSGIYAESGNTKNLVIAGNYVGTSADGLSRVANNSNGITFTSVSKAVIGGALPAQRNVISGNNGAGIFFYSSGENNVSNNVLGLDKNADGLLKNNTFGIQLEVYANSNIIDKNVVSGNAQGILIKSSGFNILTGNIVGLAGDGLTPRANTNYGIALVGGSCDFNRIGTNGDGVNDAAEANIITGNGLYNVLLDFAFDTTIAGNYIGLKANGTEAVSNSATTAGIYVNNSTRTTIGTNGSNDNFNAAEINFISGNTGPGILILGNDPNAPYISQDTVIAGNVIGLSTTGATLANGGDGIKLDTNTVRTRIGTNGNGVQDSLERNVISGNTGSGIVLNGSGVIDTVIAGNYVGLSLDGKDARANAGSAGILVSDTLRLRIGSNGDGVRDADERNVISGNTGSGIFVGGASQNVTVAGNYIGLDVDGLAAIGNAQQGIYNASSASLTIGGTSVGARNVISGNLQNGIQFFGAATAPATVLGNYIGTDAAGSQSVGNALSGVLINWSPGHTIGGLTASSRNVISGNNAQGISINGSNSVNNIVIGNYIGTNAAGTSALGNNFNCVEIVHGASNNTIGGTTAEARNILSAGRSAAAGRGISIAGSSSNIVSGNYIGLNAAGTAALGHANSGVLISGGSINNIIGGPTEASRNVIAGNKLAGVAVSNNGSTGNVIQNNWIGLNAAGTAAIANEAAGIGLINLSSSTSVLDNVISGNKQVGIGMQIYGGAAKGASNNIVRGNKIGTNPAGTAAIPNQGYGINIQDQSANNTIGGSSASHRNIISGNTQEGIRVSGSGTTANVIAGNYVGTDATGTAALANGLQGIGIYSGASSNLVGTDGDGTGDTGERNIISGNLQSGVLIWSGANSNRVAGNYIGTDVNGSASIPNGYEGVQIEDSLNNVVGTDSSADSFNANERNVISGNLRSGVKIGASANQGTLVAGNYIGTDQSGTVDLGNVVYGIFVMDSGGNTLGGSVAGAGNLVSGNDKGGIAIIGDKSTSIAVAGNSIGTNAAGTAAIANKEFGIFVGDGDLIGIANTTSAKGVTIGGTTFESRNVISGNTGPGVWIAGTGADDNIVSGNHIGVDRAGTATIGNSAQGVLVASGAKRTRIGTDGNGTNDAAEGNVISGNLNQGIYVKESTTSDTVIAGNRIGTDISGTLDLGNASQGILVYASNTRIGTDGSNDAFNATEANLISGNNAEGIYFDYASGAVVAGNTIGLQINGDTILANGNHGIAIDRSTSIRVGTNGDNIFDSLERNIVSGNSGHGIHIWGSSENIVVAGNLVGTNSSGTTVRSNTYSGIDVRELTKNVRIGALLDGVNEANERNIISGNNTGLLFSGQSGLIAGNYIGTDITGQLDFGNSNWGILLGGSNNLIKRNVISGNRQHGIETSGSLNNKIQGNIIGLTATGDVAIRKSQVGIDIVGDTGTIVGTDGDGVDDANEGNIISASGWSGIRIRSNSINTRVAGNKIGTNAAGTVALGNGLHGVEISASTGTLIGTNGDGVSDDLERNTISGNSYSGISAASAEVKNLVLAGNYIGTDTTGQLSGLGNTQRGISLDGTIGVLIASNLVSGNAGNGIYASADSKTTLQGNFIGTNATGTSTLGNQQNGVVFINGSSEFTVGGTGAGQGNIISGNQNGILISGGGALGGSVLGNTIGTNASGTAALANAKLGILVENSPAVTIGGATTASRNIISGNNQGGIAFIGSLTNSGTVSGNYIGTNSAGSAALGNASFGILVGSGSRIGVNDAGDARNITIGGSETGRRNLISGNSGPGIWLAGSGVSGVTVAGNWIGTNSQGTAALANQGGVLISLGANNNLIGGNSSARNVISGNMGAGIRIVDANSRLNVINSNWIGVDSLGSGRLGNSTYGVEIASGTSGNDLNFNVISGNTLGGIKLGEATNGNKLKGNLVGTNATATASIPNGLENSPAFGIWIIDSNDNILGGQAPNDRNIIAGNFGDGLRIEGNSSRNIVVGNSFGTNASGVVSLPNTGHGLILNGDQVQQNEIGGNITALGNLFHFNALTGIRLAGKTAESAAGNLVNFNLFNANGTLAIDAGPEGPTKNDSQDLDGILNAPVIAAAYVTAAGKLILEGYSRPGRSIQIYSTEATANGRGQGSKRLFQFFEGSADDRSSATSPYDRPEVGSDAFASVFRFEIQLSNTPELKIGDRLTAVSVGSVSEFGNIALVSEEGNNQAPVISLAPATLTVKTGEALVLNGSFEDLDSTSWTATVDYGDGDGIQDLVLTPQRTFTLDHTYRKGTPVNSPNEIVVTVTDGSGMKGTAKVLVSVANEAPVISRSSLTFEKSINEGSTMTLSGSFTDTGTQEGHTVVIQWADGQSSALPLSPGVQTFTATHTYVDDDPTLTAKDTYNFVITVSDEGGLSDSFSELTITEINNVRPYDFTLNSGSLATNLAGVPTVTEGTPFTLTGVFKDPGLKDSHEVFINWGDGSPLEKISMPSVSNQALERSFSITHTYANNPDAPATTYDVTFEISDDDEPSRPLSITKSIEVTNSLPEQVALSLAQATIQENGSASLNISFSDKGSHDSHKVIIDWGDGSKEQLIVPDVGVRSLTGITHQYRNNKIGGGAFTILVKVADNDMAANTFVSNTINLSVQNVAPTFIDDKFQLWARDTVGQWKAVNAGYSINEGDEVCLTGAFSDISELDTHSVEVQWATGKTTFGSVNQKERTFEAIFKYTDDYAPGTNNDLETIIVTLKDDDGGSVQKNSSVLVNNVAPTGLFVPKAESTSTTIIVTASIIDPGEEVFTYAWTAIKVTSGNEEVKQTQTGSNKDFAINTSLYTGGAIKVVMYVQDDDLGSYNYDSVLVIGTDTTDTLTITDSYFVGGTENLTVASLGGDDILDARGLTDPTKNVVLDGGSGVDHLFGGSGDDTMILRDGNDTANYVSGTVSTGDGAGTGGPGTQANEGGDDTYILVPNSILTVVDRTGNNSLNFDRANFGITFDLSRLNPNSLVQQAVVPNSNHIVAAQGSFKGLVGSTFGDDLTGAPGASIYGGNGEDKITAVSGTSASTPSRFFGGADADTFIINGSLNHIDLEGDSGADIFNINATTLGGIDFGGGADADTFNITGGSLSQINFGGGADADTFNLTGTITLNQVDFSGDSGADVFVIGGTVTGGIDFGGGADNDIFRLESTGSIGSIDFAGDSGADTFTIFGTVTGGIDFGGGADNDIFRLNGTVSGSIDLQGDAGADLFEIKGTVGGGIDFGGGADKDSFVLDTNSKILGTIPRPDGTNPNVTMPSLRFRGDTGADDLVIKGTISGKIDFGGGADADTLQIYGKVGGIDFGGGADADIFTIFSGGETGTIDFNGDQGADELRIYGTVSSGINFGGGADADILTIYSGGVSGSIDFNGDQGADELRVLGTVSGGIDFGGGADTDVMLFIGTVTGTLPDKDGKTGPAILFAGDTGADFLEIRSTVNGRIDFGGGADADSLLLSGTASGGIDFQGDSGADIFELRGTASGSITFGGGADADTFVLTGSATSTINFGGGADADLFLLTGTAGGINFEGDSGADELIVRGTVNGGIDFGGGADADLFAITGTASGGISFEGDAGNDRFINQGSTQNIVFSGGEGKDIFRNDSSNLNKLTFHGFESSLRPANEIGNPENDENDLFANYGSNIENVEFFGKKGDDVFYSVGSPGNEIKNIKNVLFHGDVGADVMIIDGENFGQISFDGGLGSDSLSLAGRGMKDVYFSGGSLADQDGNDLFINTSSAAVDATGKGIGSIEFLGFDGNDILRNEGENWSIIEFSAGSGNNGLQNSSSNVSLLLYQGGSGDDVVENKDDNVSNMVFIGREGNDLMLNSGNNVTNLIYFGGPGDDQFYNSGANVQQVRFIDEDGTNRLVNTGSNASQFYFQGGQGDDTILNAGTNAKNFFLYGNKGVDRFLNDTNATDADNLQLLSDGTVGPIVWPTTDSSLPTLPIPVPDDSGDLFLNRGARVKNIRFEGGVGNDFFQNEGANVSLVTYLGGVGNDNALNYDSGANFTSFVFDGGVGKDAFQNNGAQADLLTFLGGADDDSLYQNGDNAGTIEFQAGDGANVMVNWGTKATLLKMVGGSGPDLFQNNKSNIATIDFTGGAGNNDLRNHADYVTTITMKGGADADTLLNIGNYVNFIDFDGGNGPDSLVNSGNVLGLQANAGTANTGIHFLGGDGQDSLRTQGVGLTTLFFNGGNDGDSMIYNTVSGGSVNFDAGNGSDGFVFRGDAKRISVDLGQGDDRVVYMGEVTSGDGSAPNVLINGGTGNDSYEFSRYPKGYLQLTETSSGASDTSRDAMQFTSYLAGPITLDLASSNKQQITPSVDFWIQFPTNSTSGMEDVTGSQFGDTLYGNDRPNNLRGALYATNIPTNPAVQNRPDQWVYLDFDSKTNEAGKNEGEYVYTNNDRIAVIQGMQKAYYGVKADGSIRQHSDSDRWFKNVRFTDKLSDIPPNIDYVTIRFNETPPNGSPGGLASEIDYGNANLGGLAVVQVHGLLGGVSLPPQAAVDSSLVGDFLKPRANGAASDFDRNPINSVENFIALSIKIAAHELGHLLGLRHYDSFGPIGSGVHSPPGIVLFNPDFNGPLEAYETFQHIISSPASVGSDRNNDIGNLFFGEREAIKLTYAMSNATRAVENTSSNSTLAAPQALTWSTLDLPNTIGNGINANQNLYAETLSVKGKINLGSDGNSQKDYYSFAGNAGDLMTIEVGSMALRRYTFVGGVEGNKFAYLDPHYIDSTLRVYDANGNVIPYFTTTAFNDDEFESTDSILLDLVLPSSGTYRIEVGSFRADDVGNYELFAYRFQRANKTDGVNTLVGRGGVDSLKGSAAENYALRFPTDAFPVNATSTETTTYIATIPFTDPGGFTWTATIEYGDGTSETINTVTPASGIPLSKAYAKDGTYTVKVSLSNDDSPLPISGSFQVTVSNVNPTATFDVTGKLEGGNTVVTMTGTDTADDMARKLKYRISTDIATRNAATYDSASDSNKDTFVFADNGTYIVYMRVLDQDGGFSDYETSFTVGNVAPTVSISNISTPRSVGKPITVTASATDPAGSNDTITYNFTITLGSQTVSSGSGASATRTFTPTQPGTYTVSVTASDEDGGTSSPVSSNFQVTLEELELTVTPPQDGFSGVSGQVRMFEFSASSLNSTKYTFRVDWKDGTPIETFETTAANQKISRGHSFPTRGKFSPTVTVTDSANRTKSLTMNELSILAFETQGTVLAIGASDGGSENDAVIVEAQTTANTFSILVNSIAVSSSPLTATGSILVYGGSGTDSLSVRGSAGNDTFSVTTTDVVLNSRPIRGDSIETRELLGQNGNDQITINEITTITLNGGGGTDTLIGPNVDTTWDVRETGGGNIYSVGAFAQFENLTGGNAVDRFILRSTAVVPGTLDGGAGQNILDYSLATSIINVNLSASPRRASFVTGGVSDTFSLLIGGTSNDILVGSPNRSMLIVGGSGNDAITGGSSADILVGGLGADTIRGNAGEDILVGGRVSFDTDLVGLTAIFREWTRQGVNYASRISNLTGPTPGLNGTFFLTTTGTRTVLDDRAADVLYGGADLDWFLSLLSEAADLTLGEQRNL